MQDEVEMQNSYENFILGGRGIWNLIQESTFVGTQITLKKP